LVINYLTLKLRTGPTTPTACTPVTKTKPSAAGLVLPTCPTPVTLVAKAIWSKKYNNIANITISLNAINRDDVVADCGYISVVALAHQGLLGIHQH